MLLQEPPINPSLLSSKKSMLFPWIEDQIKQFTKKKQLQKSDLINLGIGDTCHTLPEFIRDSIISALDLMSQKPIGYGPEQGNLALRETVANVKYQGFEFSADETFVTEGIANSLSIILEIFRKGATIGILNPTYPVYRSLLEILGMNVIEINSDENNVFNPPSVHLDGVILCSPNNPTGIAFTKEELKNWITWANQTESLIIFDAAYASFISDKNIPSSIYEIDGAKNVAIEMHSFSKSLGFSALRLGYFIFPKEIKFQNQSLLPYCKKIIASKTNGVCYPIQMAGITALSKQGMETIKTLSLNYMKMVGELKEHLFSEGYKPIGGSSAPYIFLKIDSCSKKYFKNLLENKHVISVPGIGFGKDHHVRLSGFINSNTLKKACKAFSK